MCPCPKCGENARHYVPPSLGDEGFFICEGTKKCNQDREELYTLLGALMAGLNVPGSIGVLGMADEPWRLLRRRWHLFGWQNAEEIAECIRETEEASAAGVDSIEIGG